MSARDLDKFYTNDDLASSCLQTFLEVVKKEGVDPHDFLFLEPSAGGGAFVRALEEAGFETIAYDIAPEYEGVVEADFLEASLKLPENVLTIGNPPFGKRSSLAITFLNKSLEYSRFVGFILPIQFEKFLTQKRVADGARLIYSARLPDNSFSLEGKGVKVRTVFQVWGLGETVQEDFRILTAPPTKHEDFELMTYNCTPETEWMFESDHDFVVLRQGWGDFTPLLGDVELSKRKQWMFFKASNEEVLDRLLRIDYGGLAELNTSVRGFGKADVVAAYERLVREELSRG